MLRELPALVILERMPIPLLAIGPDGAILFANPAFAAMLGHTQQTIVHLTFQSIFRNLPLDEPVVTMRAYADELVELAHRDGSIVHARMSKSAMIRADDTVALAAFHDLTEQLWHDEKR
ncbi:PAS domain S-box protein [Mycobacterium branderi]|nr:PAS domain-containing protein [Mycobacterium branderi]ORA29868.1 histidine kinase [Mycobacterium branderi]